MHAPSREDRKRRFSDMEHHIYCGPEEFMEAGVRGFLVTSQKDREEFAIDDALQLLRQASIMIYGGYTTKSKRPNRSRGYVRIDFMDPGDVQILPRPEGEPETEEEEEEEEEAKKEKHEEDMEHQDEDHGGEEESKEVKDDEEKEETKEEKEEKEEKGEQEKGEGKEEQSKESKDDDKKNDKKKKPRKEYTYMRCQHKFKAFRTELSNTLFIKSNVPDPLELAAAAMDLVLKRRTVNGEAMVQLLPVHGVCNYDYWELEVMTQRVLKSVFPENLPPKSYALMLFDKISEPGSELIAETVRNAIWCLNPNCWQSSPLTEPDAMIRVELIGSKVVLCCMTDFMMYRQYSPSLLASLGPGTPEDDDGSAMSAEMRKAHEEYLERKRKEEERRQKEEEERKKYNEEKRKRDEERRLKKLEAKKKREEERLKKEEEDKKRREERKKKRLEEQKAKEEAEKKAKEEAGEDGAKKEEPAEEESKMETEGSNEKEEEDENAEGEDADDSQNPDSSQNQSLDDSAVSVDAEGGSDAEPKAKRGRRGGRGRAKAKK